MKKISAVLLVLVLVGSVVFAGFTGSATTSFGYNLDDGKYGFSNGKAVSVDVNFLEMVGEAKSSGDVYVDINATLTFTFDNADESGLLPGSDPADLNPTLGTALNVKADFKHAKIVGENWHVGILGALNGPNFATSVIDVDDVGKDDNKLGFSYDDVEQAADLRAEDIVKKVSGVEVGLYDYVASFGVADGDTNTGDYTFYGSLLTPVYELGDGLTAQFGATGKLKNNDNAVSGSAKVEYKADDLSVAVAADAFYKDDFMADVALAVAYDAYSLDVYFATDANRGPYAGAGNAIENLLSAKVVADIDPVTVTVTGKDLVNKQDLGASVKFQATDELAVTARGGYTIDGGAWKAGADLEYAAEDFVAKLSGTFNKDEVIEMAASVASETLVPGATLKLAWEDAKDLLKKSGAGSKELGKVTASVKIAF